MGVEVGVVSFFRCEMSDAPASLAAAMCLYFPYPWPERECCKDDDADVVNSKFVPERAGCKDDDVNVVKPKINIMMKPKLTQVHEGGDDKYGPPMSPEEAKKLVASGKDPKEMNGWIAQVLESHNSLRARHGAPPLIWSAECAEKAQLAANNSAVKGGLVHTHSHEYGHGQNGFKGEPGVSDATHAINAWYSESKNPGYKFPAENGCPGTGHFTQVVWKDCLEVGMTCDSQGKGFIFANYWPAANTQNLYDDNVFPEGTPMQIRKLVRRVPLEATVNTLTPEAQEVFDSIKNHKITRKLTTELEAGRPVTLDYKPGPKGSLKYTLSSGALGMCSFSA